MTSKTISVGGSTGTQGLNGLRITLVIKWENRGQSRSVELKVGDYSVYRHDWSQEAKAEVASIIASMLGATEPDLYKYLTRALAEVSL